MLKMSTLRRAIAGATVTAGLLAAAAPALAAPVSWVPGAPGGGAPFLEAYTVTAGTAPNAITRTCTPSSLLTQIAMNPNYGTPLDRGVLAAADAV